ncbi:MAG: hypothetical protein PHY08_11885 [Candidatus Cloacimonetes bacterium]|nr:hypothetical protein [Candidatus Cloacimonadota bacterium]
MVASRTISFTKYASTAAPWEYKTIGLESSKSFDSATIEITIKGAETTYLFDAVQLYIKPFGSFYKYNASGNIIYSSLNQISNRLTYTEEEDGIKNLIKQSCGPDASLFNYEYDDKANMESAKTAHGVTISNEYDSANNLINAQVKNNENFFETSAEYELKIDDTNYANTKTDDAGNKIKFIIDKTDHKLKEYKDALGTSTSFSYNDFGNIDIITVSKGLESTNINYNYNTKNQLDTVVLENGVVYKFNYDSINRLENIAVGKTIEGATNILTEYKYQDIINETPIYTEKIDSKQYGENGDIYYFNYNDDNQVVNVQLQKKGTTEKNIVFIYSYNDKGLLSHYNDGTNNEDYYYDENNHLILISNNESSIEYQYDNLESVCNKKYFINGKNIVQSFDPIHRSKGLSPLAFFESVKSSSKYYNKYHCFFSEERKINNITTKSALTMRTLDPNQNIIEYGILPSKGGNLVPFKDGEIPCVKYTAISTERLSYPINMYKYPLPSQSVMFWFKPTVDNYNTQKYLFSIGTNVNSNFIGAYINSDKKVVLKLVDGNGVVYDSLITTNTPIELQKWNFFSLTWFNRNDGYYYPDVCEYELVLNDEYKKIVKEDPRYYVIPSNPCDINIGYCRSGASELCKFIGHVTGLMVSNGFDMNPNEIFNYYRIGKEYILESTYTDDNVKTVDSSGTNLYNIDDDGTNILSNYDIIPLHNSLISLKGIQPSNMTIRETVSYDRDRTFNYNNVIKRYTYVADGAELAYKFNLSNSGTIALKTYINNSSDYQFLFQNVDSNNRTLGLLRDSNNILYIDFNGNYKSTRLILPNNAWKFVSFSWEKVISGGSLNAYAYNIKVMVDTNIYETQIGASFVYTDFETSVGRRKDGRVQDNILYTDSLLGQIEMFTVRNAFLSTSTINNLKEKLKVLTFTKQFDEFELIKKKSIIKDGMAILDHKYIYRNYLLAEECPTCDGRGIISSMCEHCGGTGYIDKPGGFKLVCGWCAGLGYTEVDCPDCTDGSIYPTDTSRLTTLISNEDIKINSTSIRYEYIYDKNRNVTEIKENGNTKSKYKYDFKGYLKEETLNDRKMIYNYDDNGNIFSKQKVILSNNQTVDHNYIYDDQLWPDRLTGYGILGQEKEIRYEDNCLGNPTFYGNGTQGIYFSWEGKRLTHYTDNTQSLDIAYTYNDLGLRITKEKQGVITRYYYDGNKLINEITGTNKKYFLYDENDYLYGIIYNSVIYYYVRDILGNINGLVDKNGTLVVKYGYDSYGNLLSTTGSLSSTLGLANPFIYKGYYYDFETGLYLLTTRYYNPEWGRFLNADDVSFLEPESINGLNLYAYCGNNPIMRVDPFGTSWFSSVGDWFKDHWKEVAIGTALIVGGAIVTALTCGAGTTFWAAFGGALLSSAIQVGAGMAVGVAVNGLVNVGNGDKFFDNVGDTLANSFMWGGIFSGGSQMLSGGLRWAKETFKFKGIDTKFFGMMSPDKLWYDKAGATIMRFGTRNGAKIALDIGRYGIHMHLISSAHLWVIPELVGLMEYFRKR